MDCQQIITSVTEPQGQLGELAQVVDLTQDQPIIATLQQYRWTGRQDYSLSALWRSYIASFVMDLPHTNALIRIHTLPPQMSFLPASPEPGILVADQPRIFLFLILQP